MKLANSGCGSKGFDFSSGWNCTPINHGWSGLSTISGSAPPDQVRGRLAHAAEHQAALLERATIVDVDLVAMAAASPIAAAPPMSAQISR